MSTCPLVTFKDGGGFNLNLNGSSHDSEINIEDCIFESNTANFGGGLDIVIADTSRNNTITIQNFIFNKNRCRHRGAVVGYWFDSVTDFPKNNKIHFSNTTFEGNSAKYGGGILIVSSMAELYAFESNEVIFTSCQCSILFCCLSESA